MLRYETVRRVRQLPYPGKILVSVGEKVTAGQPVAEINQLPGPMAKIRVTSQLATARARLNETVLVSEGERVEKGDIVACNVVFNEMQICRSPVRGIVSMLSDNLGCVYVRQFKPVELEDTVAYNVPELLRIPPEQRLEDCILVQPGDYVVPGQVLAKAISHTKGGAFSRTALFNEYVTSEVFGRVLSIGSGIIVINAKQSAARIIAYLDGTVVDIKDDSQVVVEGTVRRLVGAYGIGGEQIGRLHIVNTQDGCLRESDISDDDRGKVLLVPGLVTANALYKANAVRAAGVIAGYSSYTAIKNYAGEKFLPAITGEENIFTTVVLINGFMPLALSPKVINEIRCYEGMQVTLNGSTHIRAGGVRPEVVFPRAAAKPIKNEQCTGSEGAYSLQVGDRVRVLRGPYQGFTGMVVEVPSQPQVFPSGVSALAVRIRSNKGEYLVPVANVTKSRVG